MGHKAHNLGAAQLNDHFQVAYLQKSKEFKVKISSSYQKYLK